MPLKYKELSTLLGPLLRRSKFHVFQHVEPILAEFGLAPGQFSILLIIKTFPDQTQSWVAKKANLERCSLTPVIKRLEKLGYVQRAPNAHDQRAHAVRITAKGNKVIEQASQGLNRLEKELEAQFEPEELQALIAGLQKLENYARDRPKN